MDPELTYHRRRQAYANLQARQQRAANRLSNARLATVAFGVALSVFLYRAQRPWVGLAAGFLTLVIFGYLAFRHNRTRRQLTFAETLGGLNDKGLERTAGRWTAFADTGAEFADDDHPYASDLDLFGQGSLFQWITSTHTARGRATLAQLLGQAPEKRSEVLARQEAVVELARRLAWRQRFEAEGQVGSAKPQPVEPLIRWAQSINQAYLQPLVGIGLKVLPAITILLVLLWAIGRVPWQGPVLFLGLQAAMLWVGAKERSQILATVYRHEAHLRTYARMLGRFERQRFAAPWLRERQERLRDGAGRSAYQQIRRLSAIAERISYRENAYFMVLNILTLWDFQCMLALEAWKRESGRQLDTWLTVLAEVEALASLANIRFEHPAWAMPTITEEDGQLGLTARKLGHPLITRNRVANDYDLQAPARITVLTGSNMSGKSTFLRTVGINLVLAYAGAPVCAAAFTCSQMHLWTSMRTRDNLEQSISSFYAEVLRIKRIVAAAGSGKRVCFLIDEVFKGTNSEDRHQGAKALIVHLQRDGAFGLISTHDLELGNLELESSGRIQNYHFREFYADGQIHFDYILRPGVSTTRNALYLIKMMGIEVGNGRS